MSVVRARCGDDEMIVLIDGTLIKASMPFLHSDEARRTIVIDLETNTAVDCIHIVRDDTICDENLDPRTAATYILGLAELFGCELPSHLIAYLRTL